MILPASGVRYEKCIEWIQELQDYSLGGPDQFTARLEEVWRRKTIKVEVFASGDFPSIDSSYVDSLAHETTAQIMQEGLCEASNDNTRLNDVAGGGGGPRGRTKAIKREMVKGGGVCGAVMLLDDFHEKCPEWRIWK